MDISKIEEFLASPCDITSWRQTWSKTASWREWFADVLITLIEETESFSGKRPNCDSSWQWGVAKGLARLDPKIVTEWDSEGYPESVDWKRMEKVAKKVILHLCQIGGGERT